MNKFNINTPNIEEIIHQYLKGKLTEEDTEAFGKALLQDSDLNAEVEWVKAIQSTLKEKRRAASKSMLQKITTDLEVEGDMNQLEELEQTINPKNQQPGFSSSTLKVIIGAGIVVTSLLLWLFVPYTPSIDTRQQVYKDYYEPFQVVAFIDSLSEKNSDKGLFAYSKEEFPKVIIFLKDYAKYTKEMDLMMALGIAYIETGDMTSAEKILSTVSKDTGDIYAEDAQWYLALILGKQGKTDTARQYLELLIDHEIYGASAKEILNQIPVNRYHKYFN
jgi:tetratricopeptide (TPR) repeat protein